MLTAGCATQKDAPARPTYNATLTDPTFAVTSADQDAIRSAIERHWNPPVGLPNVAAYVVRLRLHMNPDGTVQRMELINPKNDDPGYRVLSLSAEHAVLITVQSEGRLPISKPYPTLVLTWDMKEICKEVGGC